MPTRRTPRTALAPTGLRTQRWPVVSVAQTRLTGSDLREGWVTLVGRFPWEWFVTLTVDPKRVFPVSRAVVEREAVWWCNFVAKILRRPVGWVCATERGRGGQWHSHAVMLADRPGWSPEAGLPAWTERNGRIDLRPVTDREGIALYTTKRAAEAGTIVLSDTLVKYRSLVQPTDPIVVPLVAPEAAASNGQDDDQ